MSYYRENARRVAALNRSCKEQNLLLKFMCDMSGVFLSMDGIISLYVGHGPETFDTISKVLLGFGGVISGDEVSLI